MYAAVDELKKGPCKDCNNRFNPWQLDFDHREGEIKKYNISSMIKPLKLAFNVILNEIAKCDLVCANCHRQRTHVRNERKKAP